MVSRAAWVSLVSLIVLIFVGATVRATGSGLGCPDWPTCWGCLIPPTSPDQIDVDKLDLDRFRQQAARRGIDPDSISRETILAGFNPVHTWIEFVNRLTSLPLGFASLVLAVSSLFYRGPGRRAIVALAWLGLFDVLANAVLGAMVVRSGLKPGIITAHMAMAFLLIGMLVTVIRIADSREAAETPRNVRTQLAAAIAFCITLVLEGLLGSQVREFTDQLAHSTQNLPRSEWIAALSTTTVYLVHRSFSWLLLILAGGMYFLQRRDGKVFPAVRLIVSLVLAMMGMGVVLAHVSVNPVVQVLHVGTTAILLAAAWWWVMQLLQAGRGQESCDAIASE